MRGNDWNNNGKYDNFDQFIDFELMTGTGDVSNDTDKTSNSNSAKKTSPKCQNDDIPLSRSLLVIALCIGAIFVPLDFEGGKLVRDIIPLCVSVLGHKILKK